MKDLANHPGMWLRDDAADSLERLERDHGVQPVNSAGRTVAEQDQYLYRYAHPSGPQDRPPYLYAPAPSSGANKSRHIDGKAVDADTVVTNKAMWAEYGFEFLFPYDKIHVEYNPNTDKHIHDNANVTEIKDMLSMSKPTFIDCPGGQFISIGGKIANFGSPANVKAFQKNNKAEQYDKIWLPTDVVQALRK